MKRTATACMLLAMVACGSSDDGGLFGTPRAASGGTASGGTATTGGSAGIAGADGGVANSGGGAGVTSGGAPSGGAPSGGGSAGIGGDVSGGSTGIGGGGTGGNPAAGTISCGGVNNCARPDNFCCVFLSGSFPAPTCQANAAPCFPGSEVYCDGPEDCINGTVCCGQVVNSRFGQAYNDLKCVPANECVYSQGRRLICGHEKCPSGLSCKPSTLLPDINVCSPS
jgi:hypothetical protein